MLARLSGSVAAAIVLIVANACAKAENTTDTTAAAAPPAGASTAAAPAAPALTDPNIVYILDEANAADSARGTLAANKATAADVKAFGRLMVGEHHGLRVAGQNLAKKLGVTPAAPAGSDAEAKTKVELDSLNAMAKGKAWDKAYIDFEVMYHQQVLETATAALGAAQNAELKTLIQSAAPTIQKHLDMAKRIQGNMK